MYEEEKEIGLLIVQLGQVIKNKEFEHFWSFLEGIWEVKRPTNEILEGNTREA